MYSDFGKVLQGDQDKMPPPTCAGQIASALHRK
jgi:hypothetical protein